MRQACELAYAGLVKLLIVAYCYVDCPANTVGLAGAASVSSDTATQLQLLLLLAATGTAHNSSSGCGCVCVGDNLCECMSLLVGSIYNCNA